MTQSSAEAPENSEITSIGLDALRELGSCGLSELVVAELIQRFGALDDRRACFKFASGVVLLAESLVEPAHTDEPSATTAEIHSLPRQEDGSTVERVEFGVTDLAPTSPQTEPELEPGLSHLAEVRLLSEVPDNAAETSPDQLSKVGQSLVRDILGDNTYPADLLTAEEGEMFTEAVIAFKQAALHRGRRTLPVQYERLRLRIRGSSFIDISAQTGGTAMAVEQAMRSFSKGTHKLSGGSPDHLQALLLELLDGDNESLLAALAARGGQSLPQPTTETSAPIVAPEAPTVPVVVLELHPEPLPKSDQPAAAPSESATVEQATMEVALELCQRYWSPEDQASLEALLEDKLGEGDERARVHISALLARYAPFRDAHEVITVNEWDTLSSLSGYRLQQGNKQLRVGMLDTRFRIKYEQAGVTGRQVLDSALSKLITSAATDYEQDWYPAVSDIRTVSVAAASEAPHEQLASAETKSFDGPTKAARSSINAIAAMQNMSPAQTKQLFLHCGVTTEGELNRAELRRALVSLENAMHVALIRSRRDTVAHKVTAAAFMTEQDETILRQLIGDRRNERSSVPFTSLVKSKQLQTYLHLGEAKFTEAFVQTFQKVATLLKS